MEVYDITSPNRISRMGRMAGGGIQELELLLTEVKCCDKKQTPSVSGKGLWFVAFITGICRYGHGCGSNFLDHLVDQAVFMRFGGFHEIVAVRVFVDALQRLSRALRENMVKFVAQL